MAQSVIHKVRKRNVLARGWKFEWSDMIVGSLVVIYVYHAIRHWCVYTAYSMWELWHACGMSNKNVQISIWSYRWSMLKRWMLHEEKRFDQIQIWLQNAKRYIWNVVSLANKYSFALTINLYLCKQKRFHVAVIFFLLF